MPTIIAHPFIALALKPTFQRLKIPPLAFLIGVICCILPDADVVGFKFGVPYASLFGHRGFTHSIFFALLTGLSVALIFKARRSKSQHLWPIFLFIFLCTLSHPLLDAMTSGGEGVALLSPFSNERFFLPWRPIRVSPIGISRFLSGQANGVLLSELKWVIVPSIAIWLFSRQWRKT